MRCGSAIIIQPVKILQSASVMGQYQPVILTILVWGIVGLSTKVVISLPGTKHDSNLSRLCAFGNK